MAHYWDHQPPTIKPWDDFDYESKVEAHVLQISTTRYQEIHISCGFQQQDIMISYFLRFPTAKGWFARRVIAPWTPHGHPRRNGIRRAFNQTELMLNLCARGVMVSSVGTKSKAKEAVAHTQMPKKYNECTSMHGSVHFWRGRVLGKSFALLLRAFVVSIESHTLPLRGPATASMEQPFNTKMAHQYSNPPNRFVCRITPTCGQTVLIRYVSAPDTHKPKPAAASSLCQHPSNLPVTVCRLRP